ncbi:hypothetical protein OP862_13135 [Yersinia massiliensis]|uniref:Uncharacterized protein n=1 Tax=Yersinia massiliensis TaxID=419257 RepID=A0A2R4NR92_9GAMM|nr:MULTISPECIES: hypothetical protein [Yersinia]AVX38626.1 hypothetical protein DA391_13675 [Yersinia massiliensis]MDA5547194.1 hypothetical protein [Yersinia massiliensis]NIL25155.1 hypothetical protein [Yersinia massiliensis]OWF72426.1 hypothetical protein B4902_12980 [Yersinia frederiksenii]PHZ24002.1 hypothetical protein CS535_09300 [Yersinia massiliensis]
MSFNIASLKSAITIASSHTKVDNRFHKADMKSLAGMMKEIKNSTTFTKMDNQITQKAAGVLTQQIDSMIKTLNAQSSNMKEQKMAALTGLKHELTAITQQRDSAKTDMPSRKEIKEADRNAEIKANANTGKLFSLNGKVESNRQDVMN